MDQAQHRTIATTIEQLKFWKFNRRLLVAIWRTITVQGFFVLASLILELAGGSKWLPSGTNISENTSGVLNWRLVTTQILQDHNFEEGDT